MMLLIGFGLLFAVPILMLFVSLRKIRPAFYWLIAAGTVLAAWPIFLLSRPLNPSVTSIVIWRPHEIFPLSPALLLDDISWPFALALATLALAAILTDMTRPSETGWPTPSWTLMASMLVVTGLGMFGVLAANPLTLLLAWAALDLAEVIILLSQGIQHLQGERSLLAFTSRLGGSFMLMWAILVAQSAQVALDFNNITDQISILLLIACGLRLGVLPVHLPFFQELSARHSLGTILRIAPATSSLVLLVRTASIGAPGPWISILLLITGLAAIYGSMSWASAPDEIQGRPFWILTLAAFATASAVLGEPSAALAWGIACILTGGLLFFYSSRQKALRILPVLGLLSISGLPFTPTWWGMRLYSGPFRLIFVVFLISQTLLMLGYIRHMLRIERAPDGLERWIWLIYPWGLGILLMTHFIIAWWGFARTAELLPDLPALAQSWPGLVCLALIGITFFLRRVGIHIPESASRLMRRLFSLEWVYRLFGSAYALTGRLITFVTGVLEGDGGVLWTILLLTLLVSLFIQQGLVGG